MIMILVFAKHIALTLLLQCNVKIHSETKYPVLKLIKIEISRWF